MLHIFTREEINEFITPRDGEIKLGEKVNVLNDKDNLFKQIENNSSKFVVIGVPEDIGIKINQGKGGAYTAFFPALQSFLNTQENQFIVGKTILILGYLDFLKTVETFKNDDAEKGNYLVKQIDKELSNLINLVVSAGKIPIVIGGGHNNAYGNIKGLSTAKKKKVNVINLDAHTDLRRLEERHSGNGFSYALKEGFLKRYFIFGLHENYTPQYIFDFIHERINLEYNTFEELEVYKSTLFENELLRAEKFISENTFGIEIDLDAIKYIPSSAMTPSGFSPEQARRFVYFFGKNKNVNYLHICEGSPAIVQEPTAKNQVGKFISYLMLDFIKSTNSIDN